MKSRLLWNSYQKMICVILLLVLPMHFKQVLVPFDCIPPTSGDGADTVRQAPEVECTFERTDYFYMYHIAFVLLANILILYVTIIKMITAAFYWQFGNTVRDVMPAYCAMVEVSVLDMKGYLFEIRDYLKAYMIALQAYHLTPKLVKRRALVEALERRDIAKRDFINYLHAQPDAQGEDLSGVCHYENLYQIININIKFSSPH